MGKQQRAWLARKSIETMDLVMVSVDKAHQLRLTLEFDSSEPEVSR